MISQTVLTGSGGGEVENVRKMAWALVLAALAPPAHADPHVLDADAVREYERRIGESWSRNRLIYRFLVKDCSSGTDWIAPTQTRVRSTPHEGAGGHLVRGPRSGRCLRGL